MLRTARTLLAVVALGSAGAAGATEIHHYELDNGMQILVREDHRAPVVVSQVWYRVGSVDEHRGVTGVSHVLEHMMFKGTDELGPGEFSETIARHGGSDNAFTGREYTAYFQRIAAEHLELCLRLEADRMVDLRLDEEEFQRELAVVREERRQRVEDNPHALTHERARAAAFPSSPARSPIIGWPADLASLTLDDVRRWYQRYYGPDNATLVVVGDVDPDAVHRLARKHFGPLAPIGAPGRLAAAELDPRGETRLRVHAPATLPYLSLDWRVPSLTTAADPRDAYALDVLVGVLDGGLSARIESNVVRGRRVAAGAGAGYSPLAHGDTLFSVSGTPAEGRDVAELEQALRAEIDRLKEGAIEPAELERVKTNVRAQHVFQQDSMFYQAMRLGMLETIGLGRDAYDEYLAGIEQVTADDVRRVAREYLDDRRLTVARLVPEGVGTGGAATQGGQADAG
ncbi:MAG: pitrilysin family protein [Halofilum sp. (in: g-proteobacteria)]|nr:pitrilysin family protein [Halofilum sp. (in: g-proteobacteria)]